MSKEARIESASPKEIVAFAIENGSMKVGGQLNPTTGKRTKYERAFFAVDNVEIGGHRMRIDVKVYQYPKSQDKADSTTVELSKAEREKLLSQLD